uniref:Uncharacterized protein n=1 Tax=Hyaloperonospora arabidopsidis (strain Emoy2) TaxID=559515 RepID=M4BDT7_HYAAE
MGEDPSLRSQTCARRWVSSQGSKTCTSQIGRPAVVLLLTCSSQQQQHQSQPVCLEIGQDRRTLARAVPQFSSRSHDTSCQCSKAMTKRRHKHQRPMTDLLMVSLASWMQKC